MQAEDDVVELGREREAPAGPPSFEELFLDVHDRLCRALYFVTGSSADAEELMQDAFLKLWERWDRLDSTYPGESGAKRAEGVRTHTAIRSPQPIATVQRLEE